MSLGPVLSGRVGDLWLLFVTTWVSALLGRRACLVFETREALVQLEREQGGEELAQQMHAQIFSLEGDRLCPMDIHNFVGRLEERRLFKDSQGDMNTGIRMRVAMM